MHPGFSTRTVISPIYSLPDGFSGYYQYDNIARVRIEGIELEAAYETGPLFLTVSGQHMTGISLETGEELSRLMPDRLTLTAGHRGDTHGVGLRFTRHSPSGLPLDFKIA